MLCVCCLATLKTAFWQCKCQCNKYRSYIQGLLGFRPCYFWCQLRTIITDVILQLCYDSNNSYVPSRSHDSVEQKKIPKNINVKNTVYFSNYPAIKPEVPRKPSTKPKIRNRKQRRAAAKPAACYTHLPLQGKEMRRKRKLAEEKDYKKRRK